MALAKLRAVGGSVVVAIPPSLLDSLHLQAGSEVNIETENKRLVIEPRKRRYTLSELLDQCDMNLPVSEEEIAWMSMPSVGDEDI